MNLNQWAIQWGVSFDAIEDLRRKLGILDIKPTDEKEGQSEPAVQTRVRLEGAALDIPLWRNNNGVLKNIDGVPVRYGLANDSKLVNQKIKSSDLIGIRSIRITENHVDMVIGQFVAREIKPENWTYGATAHEKAQLKFLEIVLSYGGDACFATKEGTL